MKQIKLKKPYQGIKLVCGCGNTDCDYECDYQHNLDYYD